MTVVEMTTFVELDFDREDFETEEEFDAAVARELQNLDYNELDYSNSY